MAISQEYKMTENYPDLFFYYLLRSVLQSNGRPTLLMEDKDTVLLEVAHLTP